MKTVLSNEQLMVLAIYQQPTLEETRATMLLGLMFTEADSEAYALVKETIHVTETLPEEEYQALFPVLHDYKDLIKEDTYE